MKKSFVLALFVVFSPACFSQMLPSHAEKDVDVTPYLRRAVEATQRPLISLKLGNPALEQQALAVLKKKHPSAELVVGLGQIFYEKTVSCDIADVTEHSWYILVQEKGVKYYYELDASEREGEDAKLTSLFRLHTLKTESKDDSTFLRAGCAATETAHVKQLQEKAAEIYPPLSNNLNVVAKLYPLANVSGFENALVLSSEELPDVYKAKVKIVSITIVLQDGTKKEHYFKVYPPRSINQMDTILNHRMFVVKNAPAVDASTAKNTEIAAKKKDVLRAFGEFSQMASFLHYYDYHALFQSMDELRKAYMDLRKTSPKAAREIASQINAPVTLDGGKVIYVEAYLRMETCTLPESEQVKFDAFGDALREDLK